MDQRNNIDESLDEGEYIFKDDKEKEDKDYQGFDPKLLLSTLRTLLEARSEEMWEVFKNEHRKILTAQDVSFKRAINLYEEYHYKYGQFPEKDDFYYLLQAQGQADAGLIVSKALKDDIQFKKTKDSFINYLAFVKSKILQDKLEHFKQKAGKEISGAVKSVEGYREVQETILRQLQNIIQDTSDEDNMVSYEMFGEQAQEDFTKYWNELKRRKKLNELVYFNLPFKHFKDVTLKAGDLLITGGFTSNGKSVLLRYLSYFFLAHYKKNVVFITLEMDAEIVQTLFYLMHANNKEIFPGTPYLSYSKWKTQSFSDEEESFFKAAIKDFTQADYGDLIIKQPKSNFGLHSLKNTLRETQIQNEVDIITVDYLTLMNPLEGKDTKKGAVTEDYNQMIKDFKRLLLTNTSNKGTIKPLLGLSAAQLNRGGYSDAIKNKNQYEISAFSMYNEIERSADILLTILRTQQLQEEKKVRLQCLKNRDGGYPNAGEDFIVDLDKGQIIMDAREPESADMEKILQDIVI